jgi:hypothetical protein
VREVKQKQLAFWSQNASAGLDLAKKRLVADLNLSAEEAAELRKIFARREAELAGLLARMHSGEAADDMELFRKICALLRNKGLREDLVGVLSPPKLATFDANEANRERETIEARAYRDMADLNCRGPVDRLAKAAGACRPDQDRPCKSGAGSGRARLHDPQLRPDVDRCGFLKHPRSGQHGQRGPEG